MNTAPFDIEGTTRKDMGVLCLHGFTGNPAEMRPLGEALAQQGFTVHGPLLPGHGGVPMDLQGIPWERWSEAAADALRMLQRRCDRVVVAGLSMGGLLALHLAAHDRDLAGVVSLSTPVGLARLPLTRARTLRMVKQFRPWYGALDKADFSTPQMQTYVMGKVPDGMTIDFANPKTIAELKRAGRVPLSALDELLQLNQLVMRELPMVRIPVLFMQGARDDVISPDSAVKLMAGVGSVNKMLKRAPNSGHGLPTEPDAFETCATVSDFISGL